MASQTALKALEFYFVKFKLIEERLNAIKELLSLCWVHEHRNAEANEVADLMTRRSSTMDISKVETYVNPPLRFFFAEIKKWTFSETIQSYLTRSDNKVTRILWPLLKRSSTEILQKMDKMQLRLLLRVITGHYVIGKMRAKWNANISNFADFVKTSRSLSQ